MKWRVKLIIHLLIFLQGRMGNLRQVLTVACIPVGNGIDWPIREGAEKYDLTVSLLILLIFIKVRYVLNRLKF